MKNRAFLVSMDVTNIFTNIPHNEALKKFAERMKISKSNPPISTHYLPELLVRLILKENSFQSNGTPYLQTHGTAKG